MSRRLACAKIRMNDRSLPGPTIRGMGQEWILRLEFPCSWVSAGRSAIDALQPMADGAAYG